MRKIMRKSTFLIPSRSFIYKQVCGFFPQTCLLSFI